MADIALLAGLNRPRPVTAFFDSLVAGINSGVNLNMQVRQEKRAQGQEEREKVGSRERTQRHWLDMQSMTIDQDRAKALAEQEPKIAELEQRAKELDIARSGLENKLAQFKLEEATSNQAQSIKADLLRNMNDALDVDIQRKRLQLDAISLVEGLEAFQRNQAPGVTESTAPVNEQVKTLNEYLQAGEGGEAGASAPGAISPDVYKIAGMAQPSGAQKGWNQGEWTSLEVKIDNMVDEMFSGTSEWWGQNEGIKKYVKDETKAHVFGKGKWTPTMIGNAISNYIEWGAADIAETELQTNKAYRGIAHLFANDPGSGAEWGKTPMHSGEALAEAAEYAGLGKDGKGSAFARELSASFLTRDWWSTDNVMRLLYQSNVVPLDTDHNDSRGNRLLDFWKAVGTTPEGELAPQSPKMQGSAFSVLQQLSRTGAQTTGSPLGSALFAATSGIAGGLEKVNKAVALDSPLVGAFGARGSASGLPGSIPQKPLGAAQQVAVAQLIREPNFAGKLPAAAINPYVAKAVTTIAGPQAASMAPQVSKAMSIGEMADMLVTLGAITQDQKKAFSMELTRIIQQAGDAKQWTK